MNNGDCDRTPEKEHEHDPYFEPIISLPEVQIPTLEEDEDILIRLRAKLYRMDRSTKEWKERGTGEVKLLHHPKNQTVRVVMRRDKTLKICANHFLTKDMVLKPSSNSERAWVWTTMADFTDLAPKVEILAIMFLNVEIAKKWKSAFEEAQCLIGNIEEDSIVNRVLRDSKDDSSSSCSSEDEATSESDDSVAEENREKESDKTLTGDILSKEIKNMHIQASNEVKKETHNLASNSDTKETEET